MADDIVSSSRKKNNKRGVSVCIRQTKYGWREEVLALRPEDERLSGAGPHRQQRWQHHQATAWPQSWQQRHTHWGQPLEDRDREMETAPKQHSAETSRRPNGERPLIGDAQTVMPKRQWQRHRLSREGLNQEVSAWHHIGLTTDQCQLMACSRWNKC